MKKKKLNIISDNVIRLKSISCEWRYKIFKSILQNNNLKNLKRNYAGYLLYNYIKKNFKKTKQKSTCILSGSRHSLIHKTNFCRQQNKRLIIAGRLDNLKIYVK